MEKNNNIISNIYIDELDYPELSVPYNKRALGLLLLVVGSFVLDIVALVLV